MCVYIYIHAWLINATAIHTHKSRGVGRTAGTVDRRMGKNIAVLDGAPSIG